MPAAQCQALGIEPGDEVEIFVADGRLTILKKKKGAAHRLLKGASADPSVSDEESRQSVLG